MFIWLNCPLTAAWFVAWLAQRFDFQLKFNRNHFLVKLTNFDPNEPSAKGKLIGNETCEKKGFGNSDSHWWHGLPAGWLVGCCWLGKLWPKPSLGQTLTNNVCPLYAEQLEWCFAQQLIGQPHIYNIILQRMCMLQWCIPYIRVGACIFVAYWLQ